MISPISTNRGTRISAPVSRVAGLVTFVAVSPLKPGSVSVISSSTKLGGLYAEYLTLVRENFTYHIFLNKLEVV